VRFEEIFLTQVSETAWEIPQTGGMLVPGLVFASREMMEDILRDQALRQIMNVAHLPGILFAAWNAGQGYGSIGRGGDGR
jgi:hypothetical protein